MARTGSIDKLNEGLLDERSGYAELQHSRDLDSRINAQQDLIETLRAIGRSGDIDLILAAEQQILRNDLEHYANTPVMRSSLEGALHEHDAATRMLPRVRDPDRYREIDLSYSLPRNRIGDLPRDEAR